MKILGYSERGIVNSLFYEIKYNENRIDLLREFIGMIYFPNNEKNNLPKAVKDFDIEILIEQSFSQFGDSDIVLIISGTRSKHVVFVEAKVKTYGNIEKEYKYFKDQTKKGSNSSKNISSNLFTQIYHKWMLIETLGKEDGAVQLAKGISFPAWSKVSPRKIGKNKVVGKVIEKLKNYNSSFFVSIIPDSSHKIEEFLKKHSNWNIVDENKISNWGFLSWEVVKDFCKEKELNETLDVFGFNGEQIYK